MSSTVPCRNSSFRTPHTVLRTSQSESVLRSSVPANTYAVRYPSTSNRSSKVATISRDNNVFTLEIQDKRSAIERWRTNIVNKRNAPASDLSEAESIISEASSVECQLNQSARLNLVSTDSNVIHKLPTQARTQNVQSVALVPPIQTRAVSADFKETSMHRFPEMTTTPSQKTLKIPTYAAPNMPAAPDSFIMLHKVEHELTSRRSRRSYLKGRLINGGGTV